MSKAKDAGKLWTEYMNEKPLPRCKHGVTASEASCPTAICELQELQQTNELLRTALAEILGLGSFFTIYKCQEIAREALKQTSPVSKDEK